MFQKGLFITDVYHCVLDAFVSKDLLYIQEIAGAVIFHCTLPMSECCKADFETSGFLRFQQSFALHALTCLKINHLVHIYILPH